MKTCQVSMHDGKVDCPYANGGVVDVETCYRCPRLRAFYDDEDGTKVECNAPESAVEILLAPLTEAYKLKH